MAHTHYKGTGKVHSFKGLLADGDHRKIRIQGPVGSRAWRITKFQTISNAPKTADHVGITKVWREEPASAAITATTIDFDDNELLACALWREGNLLNEVQTSIIVFDNALFVRNIWVSTTDADGAVGMNYYLELEEVNVGKAGMAQLAVAAARRTID
ncbi:MAG TPA: hypothetical protein EYN66_24285 [Myxococcales bacterium]|nr:hypothetical protein [Myxococcales bacterium]